VAELCMMVTRGSGFVERYVAVYDYMKDKLYTVENRTVHDYMLSEKDGELILTQYDYDTWYVVAQGPLKMLEIPDNDEVALLMHPMHRLTDPVLEPGEERLPVGDYVLGKLIFGKPDGAADYNANRVKRFGVREESIVLYQSEDKSEYKEKWGWINTAQAGKLLYFFKDNEFYQQAVKKGYLYQNVANGYHLFKDGDNLYMGFQYFDQVDEKYKLNVYEFLPAPPEPVTLAQTHNLCVEKSGLLSSVRIDDLLITDMHASYNFGPLNVRISEITADSVKLSFDRSVHCDGDPVDHIYLKPGERISVWDSILDIEAKHLIYTFFLEDKSDVLPQGETKVWFEHRTDEAEQSKETVSELSGVYFALVPNWNSGVYITDSSGTRTVLDDFHLFNCVWNAYFCDLTGDGIPELCTTVSRGSGIEDHFIAVYDYAEEKTYTLENRMIYDYNLKVSDGKLMVVQSEFMDGEQLASGQLRLVKTSQDAEWMLAFTAE